MSTDPFDLAPVAPRVSDSQRAKVSEAEASLGASASCSLEAARRLCSRFDDAPTVQAVDSGGVAYHRDRGLIEVGPESTLRWLLHALAHHLTPPTFPAHGTEWCLTFLGLVGEYEAAEAAERLRAEMLERGCHLDAADRMRRVRKVATGAANKEPGVLARVVLADPPADVLCQLLAVHDDGLRVRLPSGDETLPWERCRYFSFALSSEYS